MDNSQAKTAYNVCQDQVLIDDPGWRGWLKGEGPKYLDRSVKRLPHDLKARAQYVIDNIEEFLEQYRQQAPLMTPEVIALMVSLQQTRMSCKSFVEAFESAERAFEYLRRPESLKQVDKQRETDTILNEDLSTDEKIDAFVDSLRHRLRFRRQFMAAPK